MSGSARFRVASTANSNVREGLASALKAHEDLLLVASGSPSNRAHDKSVTDSPELPNLSEPERARVRRLAESLASSHSE